MVRGADGAWRRAHPGDGAAEALLRLLCDVDGSSVRGRFTVRSWTGQRRDRRASGRRRPDQRVGDRRRRRSGQVGDASAARPASGAAPDRACCARPALPACPTPLGTGHLAASRRCRDARRERRRVSARCGRRLDLGGRPGHRSRPGPPASAGLRCWPRPPRSASWSPTCTPRWPAPQPGPHGTTPRAGAMPRSRPSKPPVRQAVPIRTRHCGRACPRSKTCWPVSATLAGTPVIEGHGDLHVGQVLRCGGRFVVTDFDGNPVLAAEERVLPIPAALDVAGMVQSLAHVAIVARRHAELDDSALAEVDTLARKAFLGAYTHRLDQLGLAELYDADALRAFRLQQVLREIVYAARHLPRWMYVPDAALPALLDEGARVKPDGFVADLRRKPEVLGRLAATLAAGNPWAGVVPPGIERVVLLGMGSSAYAGGVAAARMRARGLVAVSELASSRLLPDWGPGTLVVATSASGGSVETLDALGRLPDGVSTVALTNTPGSAITQRCDTVVDLARRSGGRRGGLPQLSAHPGAAAGARVPPQRQRTPRRSPRPSPRRRRRVRTCSTPRRTGDRRSPNSLLGPAGTHLAAPAHRFCSAQQGALMLREGPRLRRGRLRDRRLEPRRRLSDQDHRLPAAGVRRFGMGAATRRVDHATRQHRRRCRR